MSCVPSDPRFRLLDRFVGWDAAHDDGLIGFDDPAGVRLEGGADGIDAVALNPFIPPPRLAPGCDPCEWFLAARPVRGHSRILRLDSCSNTWRPWPGDCFPLTLVDPVAVAVDRYRLAVADAGIGRVFVLHLPGAQVAAEAAAPDPVDLAFDPGGGLVVAAAGGRRLLRFTFNGRPAGEWPAPLPSGGPVQRIAFDRDGRLWLATDAGGGRLEVWSTEDACHPDFVARDLDALAAALERIAAVGSGRDGFCLQRGGDGAGPRTTCWNWFGRRVEPGVVPEAASARFASQGQLLTTALDSGVPRCVWHRLRIDADIPAGTRVEVAVATADEPEPAPQGVGSGRWRTFPAGRPHPEDWSIIPAGATDALIGAPAGRYLFVRLRLTGDGTATPYVRRIHIDFPRSTSADVLPAVYHEEPDANDFTTRFLALFDAAMETVDRSVARFPALLDGARAKAEVLPWISSFLAVALDETWDTATRRRILAAAPSLFRERGTRGGLARSIRLAFDLDADPLITEYGRERAWGALADADEPRPHDARLGSVRLFSRRAARMTLGASTLGRSPVRSFGSSDTDPHDVGAFRFSVALPVTDPRMAGALQRLVDGQKPAHTLATVRLASGGGFRLGGGLALGIDTIFVRPEPAALGDLALRLDAGAVLGGHLPPGPVVGLTALVGAGPGPDTTHRHRACCSEGAR